jgi:hypothetical protein
LDLNADTDKSAQWKIADPGTIAPSLCLTLGAGLTKGGQREK